MKSLIARMAIAPLLLIGASALAADQPGSRSGAGVPVQRAAGNDSARDQDSYVQKAQVEIQEWRRKLEAFDKKADAKAQAVGDTARDDLHVAWTKAEAESHRLSTASAAGWEDAKRSFETVSQGLKDAWSKANATGKDAR